MIYSRSSAQVSFFMLTVYVEDINDNKPVFMNAPYTVTIDETTPFGTIIFQDVLAVDRDQPNTPNSDIQYFIGQQTVDSQGAFFMMDSPHRPHVILKRSLDFDHGIRRFDLNIIAKDRGVPPHQTNTTLSVFIDDVDDLPPVFTQDAYYTKVKEFFTITGKSIHKALKIDPAIEAYDQDSLNSTLVYSIVSGNEREVFWIHPTSGTIFLKKEVDLEVLEGLPDNTFTLQIDVRQNNDMLKRAMAKVEIEIVDINDNQHEFEVDLYNISIVENLPTGFSVLQVNAFDRDQGENALFFYKISKEEPSGAFSVDPQTGWMTVKNQSVLDREQRPSVKLLIQAVEKVKPYNKREVTSDSTVAVEITLLDANDNSPAFELGNLYEFKVDVNSSVGFVVGKIKATDPDDGQNGKIVYEMKNRKETSVPFKLDARTGTLKVTGKLLPGRIALFVEACDQPINLSEQRCSLAVLTLDIVNKIDSTDIKFMGAPYEFWISTNAPIGASVGQVRTVYREEVSQLMPFAENLNADPFVVCLFPFRSSSTCFTRTLRAFRLLLKSNLAS
jgi:Cadherin domain